MLEGGEERVEGGKGRVAEGNGGSHKTGQKRGKTR